MNGKAALQQLRGPGLALDIGSGEGHQAVELINRGFTVTTCDLGPSDYQGEFLSQRFPCQYDLVWCCHTLEHQRNPGLFLDRIWMLTLEGGQVAITVPPLKHQIVGGHVSLWNAGLLLYHLVLAGFDCSRAWVKTVDYDISVIVKKGERTDLAGLKHDYGDLIKLKRYFPFDFHMDSFDGRVEDTST